MLLCKMLVMWTIITRTPLHCVELQYSTTGTQHVDSLNHVGWLRLYPPIVSQEGACRTTEVYTLYMCLPFAAY